MTEPKLEFEVLIDDSFMNINTNTTLTPIKNKSVLSLINDFEDGCWRYDKFQSFIWDNIIETALTQKERERLVDNSFSRLTAAAKNLRLTDTGKNDIGKGSELAEIILYGIMRHHYNAIPVVPKIFYKQNTQDNAKGADSVHIVLESNDFSVWFGEAKFYDNIENTRLDSIITSIGNSLQTDKLKKENSIITNLSELDNIIKDTDMLSKIKSLLSGGTSIDVFKPKLHIPILLLHECSKTKNATELTEEYRNSIIQYHKERAQVYYYKQISKLGGIYKYSDITFHLILFPVPEKQRIVNSFISHVQQFKSPTI
jgi:hypothetical protein